MSPIQKAGLYYPNKFGLITIKSLEEVMGKNGLNAILNLGGLSHYVAATSSVDPTMNRTMWRRNLMEWAV